MALLCSLLALVFGVSAPGGDWPQFRGPERNGVSSETGLLGSWPESGPPLVWRVTDLGEGYSSPIIVGDTVFTTGDGEEDLVITALDRHTGAIRWQQTNGRRWRNPYPGARASCTVQDGKLFHMNAHGRLVCLDPDSGDVRWVVDVLERFDSQNIRWGISECVLVDRGRVIVTAGGKKAFLAALDAETGETVWAGPPLTFMRTMAMGGRTVDPPEKDVDGPGYASPIRFNVGERRLLVTCGSRHYVIADADTGALLWTREVPVRHEVIGAIPLWSEAGLLFSAPDVGSSMFSVRVKDDGTIAVEERWSHPIDNCHGALVEHAGRLYGSGYRQYRPWSCIDAFTGKQYYTLDGLRKGATLFADGRLYALSERGRLLLLDPEEDTFVQKGEIMLAEKPGGDVWSHPAISDGRLFLRWRDTLSCFDVRDTAR